MHIMSWNQDNNPGLMCYCGCSKFQNCCHFVPESESMPVCKIKRKAMNEWMNEWMNASVLQ